MIDPLYDESLKEIANAIEDNNIEDFNNIEGLVDYVNDEVIPQIFDISSDFIIDKLRVHGVDVMSVDDFDIDSIVNEHISLYELIESECYKIFYNDNSDNYKEDIEKIENTILSIFQIDFF